MTLRYESFEYIDHKWLSDVCLNCLGLDLMVILCPLQDMNSTTKTWETSDHLWESKRSHWGRGWWGRWCRDPRPPAYRRWDTRRDSSPRSAEVRPHWSSGRVWWTDSRCTDNELQYEVHCENKLRQKYDVIKHRQNIENTTFRMTRRPDDSRRGLGVPFNTCYIIFISLFKPITLWLVKDGDIRGSNILSLEKCWLKKHFLHLHNCSVERNVTLRTFDSFFGEAWFSWLYCTFIFIH